MAFSRPANEEPIIDDRTPLIHNAVGSRNQVPIRITRRLYTSHFLSTWNSRVFEFGAVLYLATVFPSTLLPMSIYALTRGLSAILFAPAIGYYVDTGNRLQVVRVSISKCSLLKSPSWDVANISTVCQRLAVAASCVIFYVLVIGMPLGRGGRTGMLVLLSFLACIEKLCSIMNMVSVEKDWVS
jgi:iron-regulated transporter 1